MRRGVARDPLSAIGHQNFGVYLFVAGQLEEAKAEFLKARELRSSDAPELDVEVVRVLAIQRRYDEAFYAMRGLPEGDLRDHGSALLFEAPGHRPEADAALARLVERGDSEMMGNVRLAEVFAFRDMEEQALATLERFREALDPAVGSGR